MVPIELEAVGKTFMSHNEGLRALDNITLSVKPGEFVCIVGPSGCGKTTLIRMVGDLATVTDGRISVGGMTPREARLQNLFSWVFQTPVLLPWRTVLQNLRLPLEVLKRPARDPRELLSMVGLGGFEDAYPVQLSGGMQQRAAIARALTFDPKILLMDEPFAAVDEFTRNSLNIELLRIWSEIGVTVLFITHAIAEAVFLADRVVVLSARPGTVKANIEVPLTRPRGNAMRETNEFREIVKCVNLHLS